MAALQLHLLGPFRLLHDGQPVPGFDQARLQHLLAYLVLHRAAPVSRPQLAFAFWPDTTDSQALKNLRTLLTRVRAALARVVPDPACLMEVTPQSVRWREDAPAWVDLVEFERNLAQANQAPADEAAALVAAVSCYAGDLLPDCYDDWVLPLRDDLRRAYGAALERLALLYEERREYGAALQAARRLLQHDPLHEAAYHHLMRLHLALGDRTEALRAYRACAAMLAEEFGAQPGSAVQALAERLLTGHGGAARAAEGETPLVGRGIELDRLLAAYRRAAGGRPHIVLVSGEAGVGKTRLVEHLCRWAANKGAAVAVAHGYPGGAGMGAAYGAAAEWLRSEALRARVRRLPAVWLAELQQIAPSLAAERAPAAPVDAQSGATPGVLQRTRLYEALARAALGDGGSPDPLLLFLDDLQWCDQETLDWLVYLLRYAADAALLVVATVRKDEIDTRHPLMAFWLSLMRAGLLEEIPLAPLDAEDTAVLAARIAGRALSEPEAARIYRLTEGNPLFVVETMRAGLAEDDPGASAADGGPGLALMPPKVRAAIRWRLALLSPAAQALAQVAAAIGRQFSLDVLARASGQDEALLLDGLDELWRRHLIRPEAAPGAGAPASGAHAAGAAPATYDFSHDGIRTVAYDELGPIRRRAVHLRIADALQAPDGAGGAPAAALAYHYEQAGQARPAITYYRRAAEASRRIDAPAAAAATYRRLLEGPLSSSLPAAERCEVMLELAEVWAALGEWARMEALSRDALALAEALHDPHAAHRARLALADALERLGYHDEARRMKRAG